MCNFPNNCIACEPILNPQEENKENLHGENNPALDRVK